MKAVKRLTAVLCIAAMTISLGACAASGENSSGKNNDSYNQDDEALTFDEAAWNYDEDNDVYWQVKVPYCSDPETADYETMGIYVPGDYFDGKENEDGTYTCTVNKENKVGNYTASEAPIVFPVNTAGYSAQKAPESYSYDGISDYLEAGFIYVYAGMRGRDNGYDEEENLTYSGGAPWGVTDLKAAVRYYRYNAEALPGNEESIFTFGHSGGGAQSAVMGASGDSELYTDYLTSIGAAMYDKAGNDISDAICGAMCWCPITSLDYSDEAYEWNMGQYSQDGTRAEDTWMSGLSDDLAEAYGDYINELGLTDSEGNVLTLEETEEGIYTSGSYYDYLLSVIEGSLNNFLEDTQFPYTGNTGMMGDGGFAGGGKPDGEMPDGAMPDGAMPDGEMPDGEMPDGQKPDGAMPDGEQPSGEKPGRESSDGAFPGGDMPGGGQQDNASSAATYETVQDYINALNEDGEWITYDSGTNTASITSIEDFVTHCKKASKDTGAFDDLDRSQAENKLFGNDDSDALHFDSIMAALLKDNQENYAAYDDWDEAIVSEYTDDLAATDKLGNSSQYRQNMYNPMYYLSDYYDGNESSRTAKFWRIRTGIEQGDTALTVETNLALALEQCEDVQDVDYETVWGQGHTTAERTGDGTENFIQWVKECMDY